MCASSRTREQLHERIVKLERELDQVKNTVKKFVQNSTLVKHEDGGNLVVEQIYVNIREQLLSDFVGEEDEENFVVTDYWSGVEFAENEERTENIFRTEHGNDPLEFEGDSIVEVVPNSDVANSPVSSNTRIEEDYRNFPDFEREKVVATYSKTTPKRSVKPIKISQILKAKRKKYTPKSTVDHLTSRNTGVKSNLPSFIEPMSLPVPEVRKLPDPTKPAKGSYPCAICPDKLDTLLEAILHRKFIHPGLSVCTSPVLTLQCGKIFRSCDIKRHRIESHPLVRCLECRESFTTTDRLESHMKAVHYKDGSALPPLPEFGYDVKLIPWVIPMTKEEVQEATRDQGFFRVNLNRVEIKDAPEQQSIDQIVDKVGPSTSKSQTTEECNKVPKILESGTASVAENIHITETARVFPTELTQGVPVKPKKKKIIYNCGVCNTKFLVQSDLLQHLADAHNQTPKFGCIVCLKEFASLTECEAHVFANHPGANAKVPEKAMKHTTPKIRKSTESGINKRWLWPFMCKTCRLRFKTLPSLQTHLKSEDHKLTLELGPLEVCPRDGCPFEYRTQSELDSHLAEHPIDDKLECPECHKKFTSDPNYLLHHRVRAHGYISAEPLPPIVFRCRVENCGEEFPEKGRFLRHMRNIHAEGKYKCAPCGKAFLHQKQFNYHMKYVHEKLPGDFGCDICGKRFKNNSNLAAHRPIHREERPFLCSQCGKSFKTRTSLTIHNYSHDPDRWTKHYPYRVLVQKRLQTQRKREAAAASGRASWTKRRKSNISKEVPNQFDHTEQEESQI
ncbi:Zinc finger protein 26 [Folsomia candida]|uniref:Zinc finger protein 26 n=1 Tax=Folsomia candida TaxID=158441 RepID=A0A226F2V9_FOLCA|nr:Zinc finger protein 26 [Folsomia candida]